MNAEQVYKNYTTARNRAWEILIECNIKSLPIDLMQIVIFYNIKTVPYSESDYLKSLKNNILDSDGFSVEENGRKVIYFNDKKGNYARRRFTVAHELGHCLLGHDLGKIMYRNSELDSLSNSIEEMQANVFARDVLMPAVVLHYTNNITYVDIMKLCKVSKTSALIREERMKILEERNKFCFHPLEKQVYNNFSEYINTHKR